MFNISSFLEKVSKNIKSKDFYNDKVLEVLNTDLGTQIKIEDIEIKENILYIKTSSSIKNKIFILKNKILDHIELQTKLKLTDIR